MQQDFAAADPQYDDDGEAEQRFQRRPQHTHQAHQLETARDVFGVLAFEALDLRLLLHISANQPRSGKVLLRFGRDVGEHGLDALEALVNLAAKVLHHDADHGQWQEGEQGKPGADAQHEHQRARGEHHGVGGVHDAGPGIMYTANTVVFTAGALVFMLSISPRLTLFAFLPLPVVSIVVQYFGRKIHERFERIQAMFSNISARAQENFSGARLIRAYVQEQAEIETFEGDNTEYIARSLKLVRLMGMLWPTLETLLGVAIVIVLWIGGREVLLHRISVGSFVAFNTYMVQLTWPIISLGWVINIFQRGTASMGRIQNLLAEQPEVTDAAVPP